MIPIKPGKSLGKSDVIFNNSMLSSTWKNTNRPLIVCARDEKVNTFDGESNFKYELDKTASFDISVKATYDGKDINVTSTFCHVWILTRAPSTAWHTCSQPTD